MIQLTPAVCITEISEIIDEIFYIPETNLTSFTYYTIYNAKLQQYSSPERT